MKFFQRSHTLPDSQGGFSLIEVLIGLVLSGLLMSMVAMVLGQSVTNNEVVRSSAGLSSRMFTLRRILHRDLQNIRPGRPIGVESRGFSLETSHNVLLEGAGPIVVNWDFSSNIIRRFEKSPDLEFENSFFLMRGLESWEMEFLDADKNIWISRSQQTARAASGQSTVKAFRLKLKFDDGQGVTIVERFPYATE
ncbi:type II secretion system protein J [Desulfovibrio sp. JC022]|uniref:PulJ/GspJ family protein n=1 Tax=Desulfovibrio sp. JC022 TaxID=2593642 RepID=UPI0013D329AF|nr:prepilin-type N-terminal cleavage/methylation domain-containing protein [Desulfovibrio sp. JC022]NDV22194.1 prepilin-type N-terminal cleavage/methylation domain-containing protein [Desulfovibrio sp. JC022]